jgi:hypothetical protein
MPYSDLGVLLPTESQYGNPQAYTESIRAESNKQAQYLSNMDQFYTQLEESKRQFDLNYTARTKEFEWTSGFEEKRLAQQSDISNKQLALQEKEFTLKQQISEKQLAFQETELGFKKEQLGLETQKLQAELEALRANTGIAQQSMALQERLGMAQLTSKQQELNLQQELGLGQLRLGQQQLSATTQANQFSQNLQKASFLAGVNQAFPQGIQTGYSPTKALSGKNPYEMSLASDVYGKMLSSTGGDPDAAYNATKTGSTPSYTPTYTTLQSQVNQARGIYY